MQILSQEEGSSLITLLRKSILDYLYHRQILPIKLPPQFTKKRGGFIAFEKIVESVDGRLKRIFRGRYGTPFPVEPLYSTLLKSGIFLVREDPRFKPLIAEEFQKIVVEVTILSELKLMHSKDLGLLKKALKIGKEEGAKHGILLKVGEVHSIVLPQTIVENNWNLEDTLSFACLKIGLPSNYWLEESVKIYSFEVQVFYEIEPGGRVIERKFYFGEE